MSIQAHVESLAQKRAQLKIRINQEMAHPQPDFVLITNLKKQNLTYKEEMQRYLIALGHSSSATS